MSVDIGFLIAMILMFGCGLFFGVTLTAMAHQSSADSRRRENEEYSKRKLLALRSAGKYLLTRAEEDGLTALGVNDEIMPIEDVLTVISDLIYEEEGKT